jgi:hypothetical protein
VGDITSVRAGSPPRSIRAIANALHSPLHRHGDDHRPIPGSGRRSDLRDHRVRGGSIDRAPAKPVDAASGKPGGQCPHPQRGRLRRAGLAGALCRALADRPGRRQDNAPGLAGSAGDSRIPAPGRRMPVAPPVRHMICISPVRHRRVRQNYFVADGSHRHEVCSRTTEADR